MLPLLNQLEVRATRCTLLFRGIVAAAAVTLPTVRWSQGMSTFGVAVAAADNTKQANDAAKRAASADRGEKPATVTKGADAAVAVEYLPRPSKIEAELLVALEKPVNIEFLDLPLDLWKTA